MKTESSYASSAEMESVSLLANHQKEVAKVAAKETAKAEGSALPAVVKATDEQTAHGANTRMEDP